MEEVQLLEGRQRPAGTNTRESDHACIVLCEALFDELDNKPLFMSATLRYISVPPNKRLRSPLVVRAHFGSVL